ncbi:hypothetical protein RN001_008091 [Aquatica leii]|uniref:Uncharacterized protein n=1 Tax=Aquatica leii TaxID=1421715 RepID=A0AAN7SR81_9COLE|nr:hypothetical protein RN001_008091 [Aquatica leii]
MDSCTTEARAINPKATANIFQKLTFLFTIPIFRKGLRKDLDEKDVYEIIPEYRTDALGLAFEKAWNEEKLNSNPKLLKCFWKLFGLHFLALGIYVGIAKTSLIVAQPILIGKIVSYFEPNQKDISENDAWVYSVLFILCNFGYVLVVHTYTFEIEQLSLKTQSACCNLIYRKCLVLNSISTAEVAAGQAVTLITKDISTFYFSIHFAQQLCVGAIQTVLMTYIMYREIEEAAFAGILFLILFIPIQVYIGKFTSKFRLKTAAKTDERVKITQEILTAMRIIKMFTWEFFFRKKINTIRKNEIQNLRILFYIKAIVVSIGHLTSRFGFYVCAVAYVALGNHITAKKAFVTIGCFGALRSVLTTFFPLGIAQMAELKATLQRITTFLLLEEVQTPKDFAYNKERVGNVSTVKVSAKTSENVSLLDNITFSVQKGVTVITGPTGAGKSTLLKLLIGEVPNDSGAVEIHGKVSYASQEPWLFPATVRQNIIFGEEFCEDRYRKVLEICALDKDISTFPSKDATIVTDRGLNLSKGQKARISLARTIYKKADIYLFDDCLASVDNRVGNYIFNKCLKGFLKDYTCVLVTHNSNYVKEADFIIFLYQGAIAFIGDYDSYKKSDNVNLKSCISVNEEFLENGSEQIDLEDFANDTATESTALLNHSDETGSKVYTEKNKKGSVDKQIYYTYLTSGGGVLMLIFITILFIATQATGSWSDYFVSFWVNLEQNSKELRSNNTTDLNELKKLENVNDNIITFYSVSIAVTILLTLIRSFVFYIFSTKASINLHSAMIDKILNSRMTFFDTNLSGNIINRFSRDLQIIDELIPNILFEFFRVTLSVLGILVVVSSVNAYLLIPSVIFTVVLDCFRRLYMRTGRSLKRLEGSTRSPVIGYLTATLEGLTTIRTNQAQSIVIKQFEKHQDFYCSTVHMNLSTSRAFGFGADLIASFYISIITVSFLILKSNVFVGNVGLAITQAYTLTGLLQWGIRELAELQNQMVSAERFLEYQNIHAENKCGQVFTTWPDNGRIVYNNVSLNYTSNTDPILKDISFEIEPKEQIGVVGRTGAGKTSLISALFRLYFYEGTILIDDIDIKKLSINYLRSKISVIPQDPVLFSGTVRSNLDPYTQHSDEVLWNALGEVGIKTVVNSLDLQIHEGGSQFSVGEKQLLCLARAVIQKNNILILDEATSNIDSVTDSLIQKVVKKKFIDCTVITIAHKLQNVLDNDRIIVLDSGTIIQFDLVANLLRDENGLFYSMMKESGLL